MRGLVTAALVALCAAAFMSVGAGAATDRGVAGGNLRIAQPSAPLTLDGSLNSSIVDRNIYLSLFDTLLTLKWVGGKPVIAPKLAVKWTAIHRQVWRLKLRHGVTWQNGDPFTADDVKFTIDRVLNPANHSSQLSFYKVINSAKVIDKYTIDLNTNGPQATVPIRLTLYPMVPGKYISEVGDQGFAAHPVGTGPYKFGDYVPNGHLTLAANPNYWGAKPKWNSVTFDFIPSPASRVAALQSGAVDLVVNVPPDSVATLAQTHGIKVATQPIARTMILYMDTVHGGPLAKQSVRQAINYGLDRGGIVRSLFGRGQLVSSTVPPQFLGYDAKLKPYPYNPTRAKQMLANAGYPNGFTVTLRHTNGYYPADTLIAQAVAEQLGRIGIKINDVGSEAATYFGDFLGQSKKSSSDPYLFLGSWGAPVFDSGVNFADTLISNGPVKLWSNRTFDKYVAKGLTTTNDAKRAAIYNHAQSIIYSLAPVAFLWQVNDTFAMRSNLRWTPQADDLVNPQLISQK
jgi:peptide/nickel transport system substrate-binding protein